MRTSNNIRMGQALACAERDPAYSGLWNRVARGRRLSLLSAAAWAALAWNLGWEVERA